MDRNEIRAAYDRAAGWYDLAEALPELLGLRRLRRMVLRWVRGRVLEVAAGTGNNLRQYSRKVEWVGVDLSEAMLRRARRKAAARGWNAHLAVMDAEALAFDDRVFDTVVSSLSTCTFPDPVTALREMARVCKPEGRILLLEHGRSDRAWIGRFQDRHAERHARVLGCNWNREPLEIARDAGLHVVHASRSLFGIFTVMEAQPRGVP